MVAPSHSRGKFLEPLYLKYLDGRKWRLVHEFDYHLGTPHGREYVDVPAGFITDFASIPRILWCVLPPTGSYGKAAVLHDWLYQMRRVHTGYITNRERQLVRLVTRAQADGVLLQAMGVLGTAWWVRWVIYLGVRIGGWLPWDSYRRR